VEIIYNPGVTDPSEASLLRAIREVGFDGVQVKSGKRYRFIWDLESRISNRGSQIPDSRFQIPDIEKLAADILYNPLVQHIARPGEKVFTAAPEYRFERIELPILSASNRELAHISHERQLALNLTEMQTLKRYYARLGRNPTDVELETFAQTWSEHCKHKTFRGTIRFAADGSRLTAHGSMPSAVSRRPSAVSDLFKKTIHRVTKELDRDWCLSVFKDNSGVVEFDERYGISFKVETHNHPSALEPYGGAATGIGGVIRDCLGTGLGAKPILNTDVFCFAPPDLPNERLPKGVLHPKRILKGVVSGVRDYGNRMGIPTANGALYFHEDFRCNPLVFCGTLGIIPRDKLEKEIVAGDHIVLMGARTGRDGIHGVTFASLELTGESETVSSSAVQIGNPIEEKKVTDVLLQARDLGLFRATTDCGGGGLASAVGEITAPKGAVVDLDKVPLKYEGLSYTEIWISESQERMILLVPRSHLSHLLDLCRKADVEATSIGRVTDTGRLKLRYGGEEVADIDLHFLHEGWAQQHRVARMVSHHHAEPALPEEKNWTGTLLRLLGSLNTASKEWVIRQYDHEVQGASVVKPFAGMNGPSDGCVLKPLPDSDKGVVVACGLNPRFGTIDTYNMAASAIDEALRNITACGGNPGRTAILDNFCWGSPERPEQLAGFVQAALACYKFGKGFGTPFISGKDSFYNEFQAEDGKLHPIPPTLLISAVSVIPDCRRAMTSDLKPGPSKLYVLGETYDELGGSEYFALHQALGNRVPTVRVKPACDLMARIYRGIGRGLIWACHDVSEGGIAVALAEMCFSGEIGAEVALDRIALGEKMDRADRVLFSESNSRFIVQVPKPGCAEFERVMLPSKVTPVGTPKEDGLLRIIQRDRSVVEARLDVLEKAWREGLSRLL
jgi:phosphoribosylformylglycinamidine synthase